MLRIRRGVNGRALTYYPFWHSIKSVYIHTIHITTHKIMRVHIYTTLHNWPNQCYLTIKILPEEFLPSRKIQSFRTRRKFTLMFHVSFFRRDISYIFSPQSHEFIDLVPRFLVGLAIGQVRIRSFVVRVKNHKTQSFY